MQVDEGGLPVAYQSVSLDQELFIKSIYTIHYYEYQNDFHFDGERHDFWEFQCVDTVLPRLLQTMDATPSPVVRSSFTAQMNFTH